MTHVLKTHPLFFARVADGSKRFEVRRDDRGYQSGDDVTLREYDRTRCSCSDPECETRYTGRDMYFTIGFTFKQGFGCDLGDFIVLSLLPRGPRD